MGHSCLNQHKSCSLFGFSFLLRPPRLLHQTRSRHLLGRTFAGAPTSSLRTLNHGMRRLVCVSYLAVTLPRLIALPRISVCWRMHTKWVILEGGTGIALMTLHQKEFGDNGMELCCHGRLGGLR